MIKKKGGVRMDELIIEPLFDNILVLPETPAQTTATGIFLPNASGESPSIAEVIAVGEGKYTNEVKIDEKGNITFLKIPMVIKAGQRIIYKQWGTNSIKTGNKEYLLLKQEDALGIVKNKKEITAN